MSVHKIIHVIPSSGHSSGCGVTDHWMSEVQDSFIPEDEEKEMASKLPHKKNKAKERKNVKKAPTKEWKQPPSSQKPTDQFR